MCEAKRWFADGVGIFNVYGPGGAHGSTEPAAYQTRYFCIQHQRHEIHEHLTRAAAEADAGEVPCNGESRSFIEALKEASQS